MSYAWFRGQSRLDAYRLPARTSWLPTRALHSTYCFLSATPDRSPSFFAFNCESQSSFALVVCALSVFFAEALCPHTLSRQPMSTSRPAPVIIITGTPGTGKTTHAELLVQESPVPLKHINVGELVKEKGLYEEFDQEWQSYTVDEDKVRTPAAVSHERPV